MTRLAIFLPSRVAICKTGCWEETDYNWRVEAGQGGASDAVADIGSHWCDTLQFVTGRKIVAVMADLAIDLMRVKRISRSLNL